MSCKFLCDIPPKFILQSKTKGYVANQIKNFIKVITYIPNDFFIYGSVSYRAQPFPSDIDGGEVIANLKHMNFEQSIYYFKTVLQNIVTKVLNSPGALIGDIKLCIDIDILKVVSKFVYHIPLLFDKNGKINFKNCIDPNDLKFIQKSLTEMASKRWISDKQLTDLLDLIKNRDLPGYLVFFERLRNIIVLRWSPQEVLNGFKILSGNRYLSIEDAFKSCSFSNLLSLIKVDGYFPFNNKYVEVSNLLIFTYQGKSISSINSNPTISNKDIINNLKNEVSKFYFHLIPKYENPMKYAKRMFSLARILNDKKTGLKLSNLFHTDAGALGQINSEIGSLIDIIKRHHLFDDIMREQIDNFKYRLSIILSFDIDYELVYGIIESIYHQNLSKDQIVDLLYQLKKYLQTFIDDFTLKYLKAVDLWPPPSKYIFKDSLNLSIR